MHADTTESDILQQLKNLWQKYGMWFSMGVLIIAIAFLGFQYWQRYQMRVQLEASDLYQTWITQRGNAQAKVDETIPQQLLEQYPRTVYAQMAALFLAQQAVEKKQYDEAIQQLQWVSDRASDTAIRQVALLRLARIFLLQKKYSEALAIVEKPVNQTYAVIANEIKGDIYLAMGNKTKAHQAYQQALDGMPNDPETKKVLLMKLNETAAIEK